MAGWARSTIARRSALPRQHWLAAGSLLCSARSPRRIRVSAWPAARLSSPVARSGHYVYCAPAQEGRLANLPLRISTLPLSSERRNATTLVSLSGRAWFRARRPEPFAACVHPSTPLESLAQLLSQIESTFRGAARYSVTTSLSRALLATHTRLLHENRLSLPQDHHYVSAVVAAARSDGLYVARAGPAIVAKAARGRWIDLGERGTSPAGDGVLELGADGAPTITTEFYGLEP